MKKLLILTLALLLSSWVHLRAEEGTTTVPVKMTYVNYDDPDKSYGEIAEGETATSGFNKISGGTIGFGNTGWEVNYITYLQVDISAIEGTILGATLTCDVSGSTDSKRTTSWVVGYNKSEWSADMTYNTANLSIIEIGASANSTSKASGTFDHVSFDITEAVKNANENGLITLPVCETAAAGGYIKNPIVTVNWTNEKSYNVTFTETSGASEVKVTVNGSDATNGTSLPNGTYTYTATATHCKDYTGEFTVASADVNVEFAMTPKAEWSYTVKNNVNDEVIFEGKVYEGESAKVPYCHYVLKTDGSVWKKDATNKEFNYTFTPTSDGHIETIAYVATDINDGYYFIEGEDIEGMTKETGANANIRCSNSAGGYANEAVKVKTLPSGKYIVRMGVWGNAGATFKVNAGEKTVLSAETQGWWFESVSEEFTLKAETDISFEGATSSKPLDYILIQKTGDYIPEATYTLKYVLEGTLKELKTVEKSGVVGSAITLTAEDKASFYNEGHTLKYKYVSDDSEGQTIEAEGTKVTITMKAVEPRMSWDFTKWSDATVANLKADENWDDDEKGDGKNVTDGKCFWHVDYTKGLDIDKNLMANGVIIEELEGLVYTNEKQSRYPGIAIDYPSTSLGEYHGPSYLWLGSKEINYFAIPDVPAGATIKMGVESHNTSDARGVKLTINGTELKAPNGEPVAAPTTYEEQAWFVPKDAAASNNVTITNTNGCHIYYITVVPFKEVTGIAITSEEEVIETLTIKEGITSQLSAVFTPEDATDKSVTWESSDQEIATVDQTGKVRAVAPGETVITVKATNGVSATCKVTVEAGEIVVNSIILDKEEATVAVGGELTLTATVDPADAAVKWKSINEDVATVDETGKVTCKAVGETIITATAGANNKEASCKVTVIIPVNGITLNYSEIALFEGSSYKLSATVDPENASDKTVTWTSSNEEVATVEDGEVKAKADGEAIITAKAGEQTAECKIIVKAVGEIPVEGTIIDQTLLDKTALNHTNQYIWGADIKGMINDHGVAITNNGGSANYDNRDFITFASPIGNATQKVDISYNVWIVNSKTQAGLATYDINYFNENGDFIFGIQEAIGDSWGYFSNIIYASENGDPVKEALPKHFDKNANYPIELSIKFHDSAASITIGGNTYEAYAPTEGIKHIKLSAGGVSDQGRPLHINNYNLTTTEVVQTAYSTYTIKYVDVDGNSIKDELTQTGEVDAEISISDTQTVDFFNEDKSVKYIYVSNDAKGQTIASDGSTVVTITYREAATWNYTVKNNVNDDVVEGSVFERESVTVPYNRYILAEDGMVWKKDATNKEYKISFTPDADNYTAFLEYSSTEIADGIVFLEAENIDGMTEVTGSNADIRCSNAAGSYANEAVKVYTLKPGSYKVEIGIWGNSGSTFTIKADDKTILTAETDGNWHTATSEVFLIETETELTFEGATSTKPLDYILINGTVGIPVTDFALDQSEKTLTMGETFELKAKVEPENATDVVITWESDNEAVATVAYGVVTAVKPGTTTITATCGTFSVTCAVKVYPRVGDADWSGKITVTDAVEITNYVVEKKTVAEATKDFFMKGADANEDGSLSFADASAAAEMALDPDEAALEEGTQTRIAAYSDTMDALVVRSAANGYAVALENSEAYVALQADIFLPEGCNVDVKAAGRAAGSHSMLTRKHADNHIRVVFFNLSNEAFADSDAPMFEIMTDSNISAEDIVITNIYASDADANESILASKIGSTSGVAAIGLDENEPVKVFDVNGIYVGDTLEGLQQGTYIVRQGDAVRKLRVR